MMALSGKAVDKLVFGGLYVVLIALVVWGGSRLINYSLDSRFYGRESAYQLFSGFKILQGFFIKMGSLFESLLCQKWDLATFFREQMGSLFESLLCQKWDLATFFREQSCGIYGYV